MSLILSRYSLFRHGFDYEIAQVIISCCQILFTQIHHVPAAVTLKTKTIFKLSAGIQLPHGVLRFEVSSCAIKIPTLKHDIQVRILRHSLTKIYTGIVVVAIPWIDRTKHVVLNICLVFKYFT